MLSQIVCIAMIYMFMLYKSDKPVGLKNKLIESINLAGTWLFINNTALLSEAIIFHDNVPLP